jgi:hypothetical protein
MNLSSAIAAQAVQAVSVTRLGHGDEGTLHVVAVA